MTIDPNTLSSVPTSAMPPGTLPGTLPGSVVAPRTRRARRLTEIGRNLRAGTLQLILPNGDRFEFRGTEPGPDAVFDVRRSRIMRRFMLGGHLAFGEAYVDEDWNSPDVAALLHYFLVNERWFHLEGSWFLSLAQRVLHALRRNSKRRARDNIAAHYDLGNAFYGHWLDASMTYSSAVFRDESQSLEEAQRAKNERMAEIAGIQPGDRVLEIGCGWGGFAEHVARTRGAHVTGITLSREQLDYASQRIARAGLSDRVTFRLQDYRDVTERFDRVVSIEMIEAVGEAYWPVYFGKIRDVLKPGGRAALQAILIADDRWAIYRANPDFIQRFVFPGGMLPTPTHVRDHVARAGLRIVADDGFRHDYARTLRIWRERFEAAWPAIVPLGFDERFRRTWRYYLSYCEAGFSFGSVDVRQIALARD